jgi:phosphoribosyl 1,2-cyclic phosphate phosphodiesterase
LRILGTAAAEGWPGNFCACEPCRRAWARGGRNLRRRAAYQLDKNIRIDFGPDSFAQMLEFGLSGADLEHLLITHSHQDHWYPQDLLFRRPGFCKVREGTQLRVYGNERVLDIAQSLPRIDECHLSFQRLRSFESVTLGGGVEVTPIPADHAAEEEAFNFLLRTPDGTVLQANDTGWYAPEVWDFLGEQQLDVVLMDCTAGAVDCRSGHLGLEAVIEARQHLEKLGALAPSARFYATHFSHNGGLLHEELEARFQGTGIEVAYDGLTVSLPAD